MIIKRGKRKANFTIIGNHVFEDLRLQEELGVLVYLLSRPDDWHISTEQLRKRFGYGRDKLQRILGALRDYGYARLENAHDRNSGRIVARGYVVFDEPQGAICGNLEPENPAHGDDAALSLKNRLTEKPSHGNSGDILRTESLPRTESDKPPIPQGGTSESDSRSNWDLFVDAWRFDDPTEPTSRARLSFAKLTVEDQVEAICAAPLYRAECQRRERKRKFATTWLQARGWESFAPVPQSRVASATGVFVEADSDGGRAWRDYTRRHGARWSPFQTRHGFGLWRPSLFPPQEDVSKCG